MRSRHESEPLPVLKTTSQLAAECGLSERSILRRAEVRGIKPALIAGKTKLWAKKDADRLRLSYGRGQDAVKYWRELRAERPVAQASKRKAS